MTNDFTVFQNYKNELELILRQNPYECEMYSVIAAIIRSCMMDKNIFLRDVSNIPRYKKYQTQNFYSDSGFPDFVILGIEYSKGVTFERKKQKPWEVGILGAVEIKCLQIGLYSKNKKRLNYEKQINGHIKYFQNVIYTNGLVWQFYHADTFMSTKSNDEIGKNRPVKEFILGEIKNELIYWKLDVEIVWEELLEYLNSIDWRMSAR